MEDTGIAVDTLMTRFLVGIGMLFLASGTLASLSPARAQETLSWHGRAEGGTISLSYGIPDSDYALLSFSCTPDGEGVIFTYAYEPIQSREGAEVEVLLQVRDIEVGIPTKGFRLELDDAFLVQGKTQLDDRLVELITSRGILMVFVEDGSEEYPLDGAREAAAHLIENCRS